MGYFNILLVVDESLSIGNTLEHYLSTYEIKKANDCKDVSSLLSKSEHMPSLIICDTEADMDIHINYLREIRREEKWGSIPIMLLTNDLSTYKKLIALKNGASDYLTKPFVKEELLVNISKLTKKKKALINNPLEIQMNENSKHYLSKLDEDWLFKVENLYITFLNDNRLNVQFIANKLNLSMRQFHRKLKGSLGVTPNRFLRELRLQIARSYLMKKRYATIKEVSYAVGFYDVKYFSKLFLKRFGIRPSVYWKSQNL